MKLFAFVPKEYGFHSYFVMSESEEEAIKVVSEHRIDGLSTENDYVAKKEKYNINVYDKNVVTWNENA